jgi:hypothetical protein
VRAAWWHEQLDEVVVVDIQYQHFLPLGHGLDLAGFHPTGPSSSSSSHVPSCFFNPSSPLTLLHSVLYPSASYDFLKPILLAAPLPKSMLDHNKKKMHVAMTFKLGIITYLICI